MSAVSLSPRLPLPVTIPSTPGRVVPGQTPLPSQRLRHLHPVPLAPLQASLPLLWNDAAGRETRPCLDLPDMHAFAKILAKVLVDVLDGDRSVHHLMRLTREEVYYDLSRRTTALANAVGNDQRLGRLRSQVLSVHVSQPAPQVGEASVHVRQGQRSRAFALRIERPGPRWQCTALQLG